MKKFSSRKSSTNKNIQIKRVSVSKIKFINLIFQNFLADNKISFDNKFFEFNIFSSFKQSDFGKIFFKINFITKPCNKYITSRMRNNKLYSSMFIYILLFSIEEKDFFYKFNSEIFKQNYLSILIKLYKQKIIDKDNLLLIVEFISLLSIYERNDFTSNEFPKNRIIKNYKIFKYSLDIIKKTNDIKITKEFLNYISNIKLIDFL